MTRNKLIYAIVVVSILAGHNASAHRKDVETAKTFFTKPAGCSTNQFAYDIAKAGTLSCSTVPPAGLNTSNSPSNGQCLTYKSATTNFEWAACGSGGGSGDVTDVGPGCSGGACLTNGTVTTGSTMFVWEGTSNDANDITINAPSANPTTSRTITFPDETGTICTTGSVCTGYQASLSLGTGVTTALGTNVGSVGAFVTNGGVLGTPSSGTLTNATGLPLTSGVTGTLPVGNGGTGITSLGTGVATFLGTPSSSNLAGAVTDETGSGSLVFATSPSFTTPNLGTPSGAVLTNATGLPLSTGVTGTLPLANLYDDATGSKCLLSGGAGGDPTWGSCSAGSGVTGISDGSSTTTGSTVTLSGGSGITTTRSTDTITIATASSEAGFLSSGALTCGASTAGKAQVHTTPLQYCDAAATPNLKYAAYGDSSGVATSASALSGTPSTCNTSTQRALGISANGDAVCTTKDAVITSIAANTGVAAVSAYGNNLYLSGASPISTAVSPSDEITISLGTVGASKGGTGLTSYTAGNVLYATGSTTLAALPTPVPTSSPRYLKAVSGSTLSWDAIELDKGVTGTLAVSNGGTGANLNTLAAGQLIYASGSTTLAPVPTPWPTSTPYYLSSTGTSLSWSTALFPSAVTVAATDGSNGITFTNNVSATPAPPASGTIVHTMATTVPAATGTPIPFVNMYTLRSGGTSPGLAMMPIVIPGRTTTQSIPFSTSIAVSLTSVLGWDSIPLRKGRRYYVDGSLSLDASSGTADPTVSIVLSSTTGAVIAIRLLCGLDAATAVSSIELTTSAETTKNCAIGAAQNNMNMIFSGFIQAATDADSTFAFKLAPSAAGTSNTLTVHASPVIRVMEFQ